MMDGGDVILLLLIVAVVVGTMGYSAGQKSQR